jgi:HD-GYP domain-containing protein (c-di-GMP phosphodiesterase class II)
LAPNRSPTAGEEGISPSATDYGAVGEPEGVVEARRLPALSTAELVCSFSQGLDLAEGRPMGHAQRLCHIAMSLARSLGLSAKEQVATYYAGLLHDIGVPLVSPELSHLIGINEDTLFAASPRKSPEELAAECPLSEIETVIRAFHRHCPLGGEQARSLGLPEAVSEAIAASHEHWDGSGYPAGLAAHDTPLLGRVISLADWAESIIAEEHSSLTARRNLSAELENLSETVLDPHLVEHARALWRSDVFWLGLYSSDLTQSLLAMKPHDRERASWKSVLRLAESFADVVDSKSPYTRGKSARVAEMAQELAEAVGVPADHVSLIRLAALLHDIGQLGVPARIMGKPDILSLTEMQLMQRHPGYSRLILEGLRGLDDVALWAGAHHERPDGKGYPEMLTADLIPLESRVIAVANVYVALTSDRPYRRALGRRDSLKVLKGAAGTQLDPHLVRVFCSLV